LAKSLLLYLGSPGGRGGISCLGLVEEENCSKGLFSTAGTGRTDLTPFPKTFFMKDMFTSRGRHNDDFIGFVANETNGTNTDAGGWDSLYLCPLLLLEYITGNAIFVVVVVGPSGLFVVVLDLLQKLVQTLKFPISHEDLHKEREDQYCKEHDEDMQESDEYELCVQENRSKDFWCGGRG
jgi:hypothetical protein